MHIASSSLIDCGPTRLRSRNVSWQCHSPILSFAASDGTVRLWTIDTSATASDPTSAAKELCVLSGHEKPVTAVRFHPTQVDRLASVAATQLRLWDVRSNNQDVSKSTSQIVNLAEMDNNISMSRTYFTQGVEWNPVQSHLLCTWDRRSVSIYDTRQLSHGPLRSQLFTDYGILESVAWDPVEGQFLVTGLTETSSGMGSLLIWNHQCSKQQKKDSMFRYPAHAGPIYTLQFSSSLKSATYPHQLATGGGDAIVSLWDISSMCCTDIIARRTKLIRSLAFSTDNRLLAIATEDETIDLCDNSKHGARIGLLPLSTKSRTGGGAEHVAFYNHNSSNRYILACAHTGDSPMTKAPVTVISFSVANT